MIITDENILRLPCIDVLPEEIGELRDLLERELEHSAKLGRSGVGLALPQINIHKKMAIVRINNEFRVDLINCKIVKGYDQMIFKDEGCLSFPGRVENTMRYQEMHVVNNLIYSYSFITTGLMAVVVQHELDHLNGILLPDRAMPKIVKNKTRPNDLCHCGSKIKFKKCHGKPQ